MEFLSNNLTEILLVVGAIYPSLLFLLPAKYATKIDLGIKVIKTIADALEKGKNTKSGLSFQTEHLQTELTENKTFYQKSKY